MMTKLARTVILLTLACSLRPLAGLQVRRSLVIGNDSYPGHSLHNARNDASAIHKKLTEMGYTSTLLVDVDHSAMAAGIDAFADGISPGEAVVFYYAGHGLQVEGENYLVPTDFRVSSESEVKYQGYALSALLSKFAQHGAQTEILILDSCRENPFLISRSLRSGWAGAATSAGSFIAFGTAPGSTASDSSADSHGLFTQALLHALNSPLSLEEMFEKVRAEVVNNSGGSQVPWTASSLIGSFHLDPSYDSQAQPLQVSDRFMGTEISSLSAAVARSYRPETAAMLASAPTPIPSTHSEPEMIASALLEARGLHFDKAIELLHNVLAIDPRSALALRLLGLVLHMTGRNVDARTSLDEAVRADPNDPLAYAYRCLVITAQGLVDESDCDNAIHLAGDLPQGHFGMALKMALDGRAGRAYDEATRAIELDPTSDAAVALRAAVLRAMLGQAPAQIVVPVQQR